MGQPLSRRTAGLPGVLGAVLLAIWAFGFFLLGMHRGGWHLLVPIGAVLILAQVVRRLNGTDDRA